MLKISRLSDYAATVLRLLAKQPGLRYSATDVAHETHISAPTVSKLLKQLHDAGLVLSVRGVNGGYQLAHDPNCISVMDIIAAIEGRPALTDCSKGDESCEYESVCDLKDHWKFINNRISKMLSELSLSDICRPVTVQKTGSYQDVCDCRCHGTVRLNSN